MKIGILVLFVNHFGLRGSYNAQEIGMAKAFAERGHQVTIYKCVDPNDKPINETIHPGVRYICQPVRHIGDNAISNYSWVDTDLDMLVCFSDIQLLVKYVQRWATKRNITFVPYVGTIESSSNNQYIRQISNLHAHNVMRLYKRIPVYVKTNAVRKQLLRLGAKDVIVAPVGLDLDQLKQDYETIAQTDARKILNLDLNAKYLLMVGRLGEGRRPLDCVEVFVRVRQRSQDFRLLIVGKGDLKEKLFAELKARELEQYTDYIECLPNKEMWKAYRAADILISFSKMEIFGMSILEAMYYELPAYVIHAPGPDDIIEDGINGYLFDTPQQMAEAILEGGDFPQIGRKAHERIMSHFLWVRTARILEKAYEQRKLRCGGGQENVSV